MLKESNQNIIYNGLSFVIKREDALHPFVSGNKFRKLKYNILKVKELNHDTLITFGGAFSNHIAATAYACYQAGIKSIGIIRGEELQNKIQENPTLQFAQDHGMQLDFVSRAIYRQKESQAFHHFLNDKYGLHYLLPEGGTNDLAIKGCEEILNDNDGIFDYICCAVGTGGTIAGIINSTKPHQKVIGFSSLKGGFLREDIRKFAKNNRWDLLTEYHFGGYGKVSVELIDFMNDFFAQTKVLLDPVYTAKMVFGVIDLIHKNYFPASAKILLIHTGGLQGIKGMNQLLEKKKKNKIEIDE
jgi:1-aminocyclopropane-1-carboxylate deaminase